MAAGDFFCIGSQRSAQRVGRALLEVTSDNVGAILPYWPEDVEYHYPVVDVYGIEEMTEFLQRRTRGTANSLRPGLLAAGPDMGGRIDH
jgi:hypothetical protein